MTNMPRAENKRRPIAPLAGAALIVAAGAWVYRDFHAWLRLGSGGLPPTFKGWLRTTRWRMQKLDPLDMTRLRRLRNSDGDIPVLADLPVRSTARPRIGPHPVPHRQLTQHASEPIIQALQTAFDEAVAENGSSVVYALSHFEKHTQAITCREVGADPVQGASHGEIAHIHGHDGSMHMILSPSDAVLAVEKGWAELHGLAGKGAGLPATYTLVYSPQHYEDVAVAARLVRAAIAYMTGSLPSS